MTQLMDPPANTQNPGNLPAKAPLEFRPLEPIGNMGALQGLLKTQIKGIATALPKHVTPERLIKTLLVAANRTPDLLQCTQASILETINRAAELGLDLSGTLGEAYPVPFNNNVGTRDNPRWAKQCQLIIGYRGLAKLARQTGEIKRIDADVVYANDTFVFRKGSDAKCEFEPALRGDRGEPLGAYAYVQFKDGGEQFDFMPFEDIEKVRQRSKSGSNKNGDAIGAWKSDWPEMAKKTVFRRVAKWLPLSTEKFVAAIETDDADYDMTRVLEAETGPARPRGAAALAAELNRPVADPYGQPIQPTQKLSEEEAERIIQEKAAQARAAQNPAAAQAESDSQIQEAEDQPHQEPAAPEVEDQRPASEQQAAQKKPAQTSGAMAWPETLPDHARKDVSWIDDLIAERKPTEWTSRKAREVLHRAHAPHSWDHTPPEMQDQLYDALKSGHFNWQK